MKKIWLGILIASSANPYQDFARVCISAFAQSSGQQSQIGKEICECTAEESKHQGVTVSELKAETAEIKKDPKYKIRNKKLLAAFHYCTISSMNEAAHAN